MKKPLIVKGLQKSYGTICAVEELSLELTEGEVFGLLGHNGAGKTTSIECMLGVRKADKGSVSVLGLDPTLDRKKLFERVGVQFQQTSYQDKIQVQEICEVTASLYRSPMDYRALLESFWPGWNGEARRSGAFRRAKTKAQRTACAYPKTGDRVLGRIDHRA